MLPALGNISDQATLKSLLNQLLMSGMSLPQENQNYRRLQEELLRNSHDTREPDRVGSGLSYRESRDMKSQYDREFKFGSSKQRDFRDERNTGNSRDQDRSNFFGGALGRNDARDFTDKRQPSGSFESEWEKRRQEMIGIRDGNRKMRHDDSDIRGSSFFSSSLSATPNFLSSLQFPSTLESSREGLHGSISSAAWSASNDQASLENMYEYMYGMNSSILGRSDSTGMRPVISAFDPPLSSGAKPTTSEKPEGCHTIFIGGLPESVTEDIIQEIFCMCGAIQSIRISTGKLGKNFCHVRFVDPQSVEMALGYSGYRLAITSGSQTSSGRIHVDYAKSREDEKDYERLLRAKAREVRHQSEMEEQRIIFSERAAADLMKSIRSDFGFFEAFETLSQWLERGECTRKNSSTFYNLLSSVHSHVRRLIKEKREHEEIVERQKQEQLERVKLIMSQGASILKVFNAASKKKCWDHFSKAQRRNIGEWHQQVEKAIKISTEEQMENRIEVGMDIDDEANQTQSISEFSQQEEENSDEPEAKLLKLEDTTASESEKTQDESGHEAVDGSTCSQTSLDAITQASLEANNMKYRAQAAGLKALAEKNTSLMWEVEGYKNEILLLKQRFANVFQEKDLQIARLMTAIQALQNFFQHVNLNTNEMKNTNVKVEITTKTAEEETEGVVLETSDSDNDSTVMIDAEKPETGKECEENEEEEDEEVKKTKEESTTEGLPNMAQDGKQLDKDGRTDKSKETVEEAGVEEGISQASLFAEKTNISDNISAGFEGNSGGEETSEGIKTKMNTNNNSTSDERSSITDVVRLSSSQMVVVGFLCSYLQICPYGATTEQVLTHIRRQVPEVTPEDLEKILNSLPMLFSGDGLEFMDKTWKFNVVN